MPSRPNHLKIVRFTSCKSGPTVVPADRAAGFKSPSAPGRRPVNAVAAHLAALAAEAAGLHAQFNAWLQRQPPDQSQVTGKLKARPLIADDLYVLQQIHAADRAPDVAMARWTEADRRTFHAHQFWQQHRYFHEHYAGAEFLVLTSDGQTIGRLYWWVSGNNAVLIDLSLIPAARGSGVGTQVLEFLTALADRRGLSIALQLETASTAQAFFRQYGFSVQSSHGGTIKLRRKPRSPTRANAALY